MKNIKILIIIVILCFSCKAQNIDYKLDREHDEILNAFINQKYGLKNVFYLYKFIQQKKYTSSFEANYKKNLSNYKFNDSICRNSKDTLNLKFRCPYAFSLRKYVDLISNKDLKFFKNTYSKDEITKRKINTKELQNSIPLVLEHSDEFYSNYLKDNYKTKAVFSKELPSLVIDGLYFSKNKQIALIAHTMIESFHGGGLAYSIMKKEDGIWWRLVGTIQITFV